MPDYLIYSLQKYEAASIGPFHSTLDSEKSAAFLKVHIPGKLLSQNLS